ncbi:MAG: hypothetical protein K2X37_07355, partial [Chitinophagaceae bacterium]|nr:hypothetical protein [Chitinophagaceae bacterium]
SSIIKNKLIMTKEKLNAMSIHQMNTEEMKIQNGGFLITSKVICLIIATALGISAVVIDAKEA